MTSPKITERFSKASPITSSHFGFKHLADLQPAQYLDEDTTQGGIKYFASWEQDSMIHGLAGAL